jgi:SAM-dependent methyltransferase
MALRMAFDGLNPHNIDVWSALSPLPGRPRQVLDVGCGDGGWYVWIMLQLGVHSQSDSTTRLFDMARAYPRASFMGINVVAPFIDFELVPSNVLFEVADLNDGLDPYYDRYDLVHVAMTRTAVLDMEVTLKELRQCLLPGGILIVVDISDELFHGPLTRVQKAQSDNQDLEPGSVDNGSSLARVLHGMIFCHVCHQQHTLTVLQRLE